MRRQSWLKRNEGLRFLGRGPRWTETARVERRAHRPGRMHGYELTRSGRPYVMYRYTYIYYIYRASWATVQDRSLLAEEDSTLSLLYGPPHIYVLYVRFTFLHSSTTPFCIHTYKRIYVCISYDMLTSTRFVYMHCRRRKRAKPVAPSLYIHDECRTAKARWELREERGNPLVARVGEAGAEERTNRVNRRGGRRVVGQVNATPI